MRGLLLALVVVGCGKGEVDEYRRKSMETEGRLLLNRMSKFLQVAQTENGTFPKGSTGLTPSTPCCQQPTKECAPSPKNWEHET